MILNCSVCGSRYETKRNDPSTWGCPCTTHPSFTVAPRADKTKFAPAKKEIQR